MLAGRVQAPSPLQPALVCAYPPKSGALRYHAHMDKPEDTVVENDMAVEGGAAQPSAAQPAATAQPAAAQPQGARSPKRGPLVALACLVVVVVAAFVGYNALSAQAAGEAGSAGTAGAQGSSAQQASKGSYPQLSDYDVTVFTEYGDARTLSFLADGKPLVLNFWATWCPYCVQEMGDYQEIYDDYAERVSFAFIDVADGKREKVEDAAEWLYDNDYTLPAYYDTTLKATYKYGATNLPTTAVIDPDRLRAQLDELLED